MEKDSQFEKCIRRSEMRANLINARKEKGYTQQYVADYIGISVRSYQRIEAGFTAGKIKHWDMLEDLFEIPQRRLREVI